MTITITRALNDTELTFIENLDSNERAKDRSALIGTIEGTFPYEDVFFNTFTAFAESLCSPSFREGTKSILDKSKANGDFLSSREAFDDYAKHNIRGLRFDTDSYSYLWSFKPEEKQCIKCYCFIKDYLDDFLSRL